MTLYLFNFNNYYNRIVKRYTTLAEYNDNGNNLAGITGVNFNPNDGIYTKQVVNYNGEAMPDYLIVADEYGNIISRWYIIESRRTRGGQFEIELYRDVIAEWYVDIVNAPCFIEKATVGMYDTAIFNNEDMTFNQIKTKETLIKDKAGCGWYVGYVAANTEHMQIQIQNPALVVSGEYSSIEEYPYNQYAGTSYAYDTPTNLTFSIFLNRPNTQTFGFAFGWDSNKNVKTPIFNYFDNVANSSPIPYKALNGTVYPGIIPIPSGNGYNVKYSSYYPETVQKLVYEALSISGINWDNNSNSIINYSATAFNELKTESGKVYKIGQNYYRIALKKTRRYNYSYVNNGSSYALNYAQIARKVGELDSTYELTAGGNSIVGSIEWEADAYQIIYEQVDASESTITVDFLGEKIYEGGTSTIVDIQTNQPYKCFAIPYGDVKVAYDQGQYYLAYRCDRELAKKLVSQIILTLGDKLYDIQLLPYAPIDDYHFRSEATLDYSTFSSTNPKNRDKIYTVLTGTTIDTVKTFIIYPDSYETIRTISDHKIAIANDNISQKVQNCCDKYRLVSPNYNGQFEFSAAKNYGVNSWNVIQSCKPFSPYIRVAPNFNGLYGSEFKDARGLICGGDFSITQYESAWINYQIQNKNFQVMFDRQIQNMEVNNSVQRTQDIFGAIAGTAQGASSGAMAGYASGMPYGAIAGAAIGGVTSAAAGIADVFLSEKLRKEALDFTKDQFGYSLQNIQALPYSLTKVGTQNADFKLFPFLEYFTCTEIERQALVNKIKYNGMTVMRIGQINDFIQPQRSYIKAKLIRLEAVEDDYHVLNAISKELNEGVYI